MRTIILSTTFLIALLSSVVVSAAVTSDPASYPLEICIVSGEILGDHGDVVTQEVDGREIKLCCKSCAADIKKDSASYLKTLDEALIAAQLPYYPLKSCIVSGEALGGTMGDPVDHLVGNRLVRLCCNMCKKELATDPAAIIAKLDNAVLKDQLADYPGSTCPITGQKLGSMGDPYNYVFAGRLVQFCCGGCVGKFNDNPTAAMTTIYGADTDANTDAEVDAATDANDETDHSGHVH